VELVPVASGVGLLLKYRFCDECGQKTETHGPCQGCGSDPAEVKEAENIPKPAEKRDLPYVGTPKLVVKPWDHLPNPLARFMSKKTMANWGFGYDLRWAYLIIGVACFFLFRLFFVLLFWQYDTLFDPFYLSSDLIHGVLVGSLVGMRGSGAGKGAKFGALVSFLLSMVLLFPVVILAFIGITFLVPEAFKVGGQAIVSLWLGLSGMSTIKGAIVGAFVGFYIDHARE